MELAQRKQNDDLQDEYSDLTALSFEGEESLTRQEFADEADLNILLARFGVGQVRPMEYGKEVDYSVDLQSALGALDAARAAAWSIPEELKDRYRNWQDVLNAAETGQYQQDLLNLAEKKRQATKDAAEREKRRDNRTTTEEPPKPVPNPAPET